MSSAHLEEYTVVYYCQVRVHQFGAVNSIAIQRGRQLQNNINPYQSLVYMALKNEIELN